MDKKTKITVVIVTYKVKAFLKRCLDSLKDATENISTEIIIVDNASFDGTCEYVKKEYPDVKLICNNTNSGFGSACNQGIETANGEYVLLLNPDTIVQENTLLSLSDFLDNNKNTGAVGPKIIGEDGKLQPACRRSFPTPWIALSRFLHLSTLFPKSKLFGKYNLSFADPDKVLQVDALSGSCMMLRKKALMQVGAFDEEFFLYGEDIDLCYRIKKSGFDIYYTPETQIIHFKGKSAKKSPVKSLIAFYNAMYIFSKKHITAKYSFVPKWFLYTGIVVSGVVGLLRYIRLSLSAAIVDVLIINAGLFVSIKFWFGKQNMSSPYMVTNKSMYVFHIGLSFLLLILMSGFGVYGSRRKWKLNSFKACIVTSLATLSVVYIIKDIAYSRVAFIISSLINIISIPGWRLVIDKVGTISWWLPNQYILVVGTKDQVSTVGGMLSKRKRSLIPYIIDKKNMKESDNFSYSFANEIKRNKIDEIIVFENQISYTVLIEAISSISGKKPIITMASFASDKKLILAELGTTVETL